jgi:hypothetical protein
MEVVPISQGQDAHAAPRRTFALTPTSLAEAMEFAGMMSKSSIVPKDYQGQPGNILVAVQWGAEIGLAPLQAMQSIAVINGRPAVWGDAMLALVRGSGLLEYIREDISEAGATVRIKRRGEVEAVREYTVEDAKRAGLWGKAGPWQQHPKRMMQMRARAFALRDVFPDVLRGVHVAEEVIDLPAEPAAAVIDQPSATEPTKAKPTRADRARDALARKAPTIPPPSLGLVLGQIGAAASIEALAAAGDVAAKLERDDDKARARAAYKDRLAELQAPPPDTAPAPPPAGEHDDFIRELDGE